MIAATRRWLRRNRNSLLIGAGVIGAGYFATQYVLGKIQEARQRMREEKIAKENLRRRFEQNQDDCTYTVLALLPTVRDEIIGALPVEQITDQLQQERQERLKRLGASEAASSEYPSAPPSATDDDGRSLASLQSSSYVHASQVAHSTLDIGEQSPRPKRSKAQLWQDMKIHSIARALTLIYTLSLLTLLTRIQLNLLGRRTYLSSVVALASPPPPTQSSTISLENRDDDNYDNVYGNEFETNRKYLTFSWWLLHRGSKHLMQRVMSAVKDVFGGVNIREDITLERLADLIMQVRRKVEGATEEERRRMKWLEYLLPPREEETFVIRQAGMSESDESPSPDTQPADPMDEDEMISESLRRLLDETSDLVDSPTFSYVLTRLLDSSFSHLIDYRVAVEAYKTSGPAAPTFEERITEIPDTKCKVAHILPVFCKQAHVIAQSSGELDAITGEAAQENEYLAAMNQVPDLQSFAAVIYSSNFEYEMPEAVPEDVYAQRGGQVSNSSNSPDSIAQEIADSPPKEVPAESVLEESEVLVLNEAQEEDAQTPAKAGPASDFEAAREKATSSVDGEDKPADDQGHIKLA
ncbi:hypothetical protein M409DRAFT_28873 [Zasmidium cellare ATCC 36951]|uniref:Peroxin-3 n=1 Tax=Zasmidium cellare ATCC 36951 TaxID=1080233 RepID=A0A6A6C5R6_ZASCE|nr:uncharacterized protein M409DRAFT_28873 [Zasmidium cellare ATCC 36951]KAF2160736.1 hypothetical protein M409DRAFT_28873 [Zasmidium cellare ATCC 36951]